MKKRRDLLQLLLSVAIIGLVNFIASFYFFRIDLTSDKRYTLAPATKKLLGELEDIVFLKIYLDGELPSGFDRLKQSTREILDEFRVYSDGNVEYQFINPLEEPDKKKQDEMVRQLMEKGLQPTYIEMKVEAGTTQQTVFPAALASYRTREFPLQLFREQMGVASEVQLNNSIQSLEYELSAMISLLTADKKDKVAFTTGHGELDSIDVAGIAHALGNQYSISRLELDGKLETIEELNRQEAIIIAKPDSAFREQDKFMIDQFIMQGGKVMWLVDGVFASMDSLTRGPETFAIAQPLNIENMLFRYGVRINSNMVLDLRSGMIPVPVNQKYKLMPWHYFPLLSQASEHPIVKNLNLIKSEFCSTIDTVNVQGVHKTPLLASSRYTSVQNAPARIDIRSIFNEPDVSFYNTSNKPVAYLLEGVFESIYKNRPLPGLDSIKGVQFNPMSDSTKMIVIADGDIIKNSVQRSARRAYPLGYDIYTGQTYGNRNFILNAVNYLCDDSGLLEVRSREVKMRMLDRQKVNKEKMNWQITNTALPILGVVLFGIFQAVLRKRKFAR